MTALGFAVLAVAGALVRAAAAQRFNAPTWPWGTLGVNVAGSFALGLLVGSGDPLMTALGAGGLGSLTTLSAFAVELTTLGRKRATAYIAVSLAPWPRRSRRGLAIAA